MRAAACSDAVAGMGGGSAQYIVCAVCAAPACAPTARDLGRRYREVAHRKPTDDRLRACVEGGGDAPELRPRASMRRPRGLLSGSVCTEMRLSGGPVFAPCVRRPPKPSASSGGAAIANRPPAADNRPRCSGSCPHSRRGITPSENPAQDAERYARVATCTPGSLGAKRTKTTEVTQTQR